MRCRKCKRIIEDEKISFCPFCGNNLSEQKEKSKKIKKITLIGSALVMIAVVTTVTILNLPCRHRHWIEATCDHPRTCEKCGYTEGNRLEHDFEEATCEKPKVCKLCGKTEGEPLGHDYDKASCEKEGICKRCGKTIPAEGHKWTEATCTEASVCTKCGAVGADALGHNFVGNRCTRCGADNITKHSENKVVYSAGGLEITYLGYEYEQSEYGRFKLNFKIVNNCGYEERIQVRDESVNGYMCDFTMSEEVLNGKSAITDASIGHYELSSVGLSDFSEIKTIQLKFIRCNTNYTKTQMLTFDIN